MSNFRIAILHACRCRLVFILICNQNFRTLTKCSRNVLKGFTHNRGDNNRSSIVIVTNLVFRKLPQQSLEWLDLRSTKLSHRYLGINFLGMIFGIEKSFGRLLHIKLDEVSSLVNKSSCNLINLCTCTLMFIHEHSTKTMIWQHNAAANQMLLVFSCKTHTHMVCEWRIYSK